MSSTPTKAMLAAALGRPYYISFGGTVVYPYAADAAAVFIRAARAAATCPSAPVFNMGGSTAHMAEVIAAFEAAAPEITVKITFATATLSLPEEIDSQPPKAALGPTPWIPLSEGVRRTMAQFRQAVEAGKLNLERAIA